jgi:hypothetical protein
MTKTAHCSKCDSQMLDTGAIVEWSPSHNDWTISELDPEVYCHDCEIYLDSNDIVYKENTYVT